MSLSTLCLECGLCCDGTVVRFVVIDEAERAGLVKLGIELREKKDRPVMVLPCGKLEGKCCSVYEARPGGCRRFVCALGQQLQRKELTLDEARTQVAEMHARLDVLGTEFGSRSLRAAREAIDSTGTPVTEAQLAAFKRVEDLRYEVFMPPPQPGQ
jgi:Fe-S-cluster containining protein